MTFHNLEHTQMVVNACREIGRQMQILDEDQEVTFIDADFYHLASEQYFEYLSRFRNEWEWIFNAKLSDEAWYRQNLSFLRYYQYYTTYGQKNLEKGKQKNLKRNLQILESVIQP